MLKAIRHEDFDWICVAQDKASWLAVVKTVKKLRV
jgi:hypothetical protein